MNTSAYLRRMAFLALCAPLATACSNGDTDTNEPSDETVDTFREAGPLEPSLLLALANFAIDDGVGAADTDADTDVDSDTDGGAGGGALPPVDDAPTLARSYTSGTNTIPVVGTFLAANDAWDFSFADDDNYCVIEISIGDNDTVGEAAWVANITSVVFGFDMPGTATVNAADCAGKLDTTVFTDVGASFAAIDVGFGVMAALPASFRTQLLGGSLTEDDIKNWIGGGVAGTLGALVNEDGWANTAITTGDKLNDLDAPAPWAVATDGGGDRIELTPAEMIIDGKLRRGAYSIEFLVSGDRILELLLDL